MVRYRFSRTVNEEFARVLRARVNNYFRDNDISRKANSTMVVKTAVAISLYLALYLLVVVGQFENLLVLFALWIGMGFMNAFIGLSVMHEAFHGNYSKKKSVNTLVGIAAIFIGVNDRIWKIQHNHLHHNYTNIEDADEDIQPRYLFRFSPNQPKRWFHPYQHLYVMFFYSISTMVWVFAKDYLKIAKYLKKGLVKPGRDFWFTLGNLVGQKFLYYFVLIALPMMLLPQPWWLTMLMFMSMHVVAGTTLSMIFQSSHITETSIYIDQEEEHIDENWAVHQLMTTVNYGMNHRFLTWFCGGLNYQIEHHLFPNICHVHYPPLSKIVQETAKEYNLPYYTHRSAGSAMWAHLTMLRKLGKEEPIAKQEPMPAKLAS